MGARTHLTEQLAKLSGATGSQFLGKSLFLTGAASDTELNYLIEIARSFEALDRAGRRLGLCFQIRDDWLGLWGDSAATGKSTDNDIRRRKKSYPIVYAFEEAAGSTRETLEAIYAQESMSDGDVETVMGILTSLGASEATQRAAREHHDGFREELSSLQLDSDGQTSFDEIADFILQRDL